MFDRDVIIALTFDVRAARVSTFERAWARFECLVGVAAEHHLINRITVDTTLLSGKTVNHLEQKGNSQYLLPGHLLHISSLALPKGEMHEMFFFNKNWMNDQSHFTGS